MLISGGGATPGVRESSPEDVVAIHRTPSIFVQLLLDNLRHPSTVTHSDLATPMAAAELATNAITATEPEPVSAGDPASRSLFTLSILSPLDALRERLSHAKRRKDEAESRVRLLQAKRKSLRSLGRWKLFVYTHNQIAFGACFLTYNFYLPKVFFYRVHFVYRFLQIYRFCVQIFSSYKYSRS